MKHLALVTLFCAFLGGCGKKKDDAAAPAGSNAPAAPVGAPAPVPAPAAAPAASGPEACDLITAEKLTEIAKVKLKKGEPSASGTTSQCGWSRDDNSGQGGVSITFYKGATGASAWKNMAALKGEPVTGVGDEAMLMAARALRVRKGDNVASINFNFTEGTVDQLKAVGTEVATKM